MLSLSTDSSNYSCFHCLQSDSEGYDIFWARQVRQLKCDQEVKSPAVPLELCCNWGASFLFFFFFYGDSFDSERPAVSPILWKKLARYCREANQSDTGDTLSFTGMEPPARVPQAAARPLAPGDVWKASSSWVFLFSRSAFNWFLTAVRFLLVTGMKLLLFFSLGDLLISSPLSLWLWQLCGFCNWFILSQCFL